MDFADGGDLAAKVKD